MGYLKKDCPQLTIGFGQGYINLSCSQIDVVSTHINLSCTQIDVASTSRVPSTSIGGSGVGSGLGKGSGRGYGGKGQASSAQGIARVYALTIKDAQSSNIVVTSILTVCSFVTHVLFDPDLTNSYVSPMFAKSFTKE